MTTAVRIGVTTFPVVLSTAQAARILGISEEACRRRCEKAALPLLPRLGRGPWRIPTGKLCQELGLDYETVTVEEAS